MNLWLPKNVLSSLNLEKNNNRFLERIELLKCSYNLCRNVSRIQSHCVGESGSLLRSKGVPNLFVIWNIQVLLPSSLEILRFLPHVILNKSHCQLRGKHVTIVRKVHIYDQGWILQILQRKDFSSNIYMISKGR